MPQSSPIIFNDESSNLTRPFVRNDTTLTFHLQLFLLTSSSCKSAIKIVHLNFFMMLVNSSLNINRVLVHSRNSLRGKSGNHYQIGLKNRLSDC
ncbi:CLUMA_CG015958, isoform A [Clunio marinus]|uniref:CLUMA_CG015958, isoform A n=1 Tax=Clunio marinus TaxID=568069 RepID=A0A1J1IR03_9DIPT|nr:CLUMA_CG015958, isoform A [Clunio marinus]